MTELLPLPTDGLYVCACSKVTSDLYAAIEHLLAHLKARSLLLRNAP